MPKGRIGRNKYPRSESNCQVVDISDNAKKEARFGEKAESIMRKGVINNINQLLSININQDECKNINETNSNESQSDKLIASDNSTDAIVNALIAHGFPAEKFDYPDAIPAIERLQQLGASVDLFIKAHGISSHATHGNKFGVRYLVKVVEGLLVKSQKSVRNNIPSSSKNERKKTNNQLSQTKEYVYENELKNAMSWAADLV